MANVTTPLSIVFAGTPDFGLPCLDAIAQSHHHLLAAFTQPDRPAGRGQHLQASAVKTWALANEIPIHQPANFKDPAAVATLAALKPDVLVVIAYGLILPETVLAIPTYACINVHASLLPRWRGASPIQQAILHGDFASGVCIMQMDKGMDTGGVYTQRTCPIEPNDTSETLQKRLAQLAVEPLMQTLDAFTTAHQPQAMSQRLDGITYAPKIKKSEALIDWSTPAQHIHQQIRAFQPWPVAYTHLDTTRLMIHQASISQQNSHKAPGTIVQVDKHGITVATGQGCLIIEKLQWAGGKVLAVANAIQASHSLLTLDRVLQ